ncbi:MAG: hypothetical protein K2I03_01175 [Lachnospiraceae bacterium]|nr:hypothetical protein [Lachnospiraceae bacterium]
MLHLIKVEWKKVCVPVVAVTILISAVACILSCTMYRNYAVQYDLEAWEIGTEFFSFVFPLFVVLPLCWNIFYERKNNFMLYVLPRVSEKKYLTAKWLVYAASSFFILFIPYMVSAIAALYVNPPFDTMNTAPFEHVFIDGFTKTPLLYAFLLSCWKGLIGILTMSLGFVIALYVKNIFVVLTGAFIYAILENFILAVLRLEQYRLVTAFEPSTISVDAVSLPSFIVGPLLLIIVISLTVIYFKWIKKTAVVSV